jgi:AraC-like DNA-binding protein/ligand-binding sensor protein
MSFFNNFVGCINRLDLEARTHHHASSVFKVEGFMASSTGQSSFEILEQVHAVRGFETAFRQATGLSVRLRPLPEQPSSLLLEPDDNPLCLLARSTATGRTLCHQVQSEIRHAFEQKQEARPIQCMAGLAIIAVPVRVGGEYVATLHTNRIFLRQPQPVDIQNFAEMVACWGAKPNLERLRSDFAGIPVVAREQLDAMVKLLTIYADHLGDLASRRTLAERRGLPSAMSQALTFVREHQTERLHLRDVAEEVHLSPFYFCKLFHKTTGMTFTDYLARLRLERAKDMLLNHNMPVGDIAFASGFGSVPHFNRAFKRYTSLTPTSYRGTHACLRSSPVPAPLAA